MYLTGQRKKYISFLIVGIMVFVTLAGAVLSAPVCVYALSLGGLRGTIASLIISLMLEAGVAPVNNTWVNSLNNAFGVESSIGTIDDMITNGLLTESGGTLIDTGLSQAIEATTEYTSLGIDDIFTTLSTDAGVVANSGAVNLANQAIHLGTGGTIGAFAGAVAIGVGVGVLANHLREKFTNFIKYGFPMNADDYLTQSVSGYNGYVYFIQYYDSRLNRDGIRKINLEEGRVGAASYTDNGEKFAIFLTDTSQTKNYHRANYNLKTGQEYDQNSGTLNSSNSSYTSSYGSNYLINAHNYYPHFDNVSDYRQYVEDVRNGSASLPPIYSPDLIGQNGNQVYNDNTNNVPDIRNIVPEGHDMEPVDMDDYLNYVNQANENTEDGNVDEDQGTAFDEFVDPYFVDTSNQPIIPDNPNEVPTYPDRPVNPDQPTIPDKPDVTNEDIQQSLEGATTIDLRSVFPFCIPWDIYNLVLIFDTGEEREAPHITFTFPFNENWVVDVDLAEYDSVAGILRLLELIVFIVGLMVATRSLIGAKG